MKSKEGQGNSDSQQVQTGAASSVNNPFENNQPVEKDIADSQDEIDKEQEFKEAQTERD